MALNEHVNAFQLIDCRAAMRAHLPYTTTEVAGGIYDQNCVGRLVVNVGMRIDLAPFGKKILPMVRSGFGPVPPPLRAETWPKDHAGSQFLSTFQFSAPAWWIRMSSVSGIFKLVAEP
jgi:hypothetical protein